MFVALVIVAVLLSAVCVASASMKLLSCLPLVRRAARVLVRTLRSFAARYGPRAGPSLLAFRGL
jgi:hypothetical protein